MLNRNERPPLVKPEGMREIKDAAKALETLLDGRMQISSRKRTGILEHGAELIEVKGVIKSENKSTDTVKAEIAEALRPSLASQGEIVLTRTNDLQVYHFNVTGKQYK